MAKLFFLLSGEHETLPVSELRAILETGGYAYGEMEKLDQVLRLDADLDCVKSIRIRTAFTRLCGLELFNCITGKNSIEKSLRSIDLSTVLADGESFAVRLKRVKDYASKYDVMSFEKRIGKIILEKNAKLQVNLKKPDKTFAGILTNNRIIFGLKLAEIPAKPFVERRPRKKPFFHPSAMQAKLSRCMVNLAQPKAGELVFDPFCGTGSMLIEAGLIDCRVMGLDVQRRMTRGCLRNLKYFGIKPEGIVLGDARHLPVAGIDCVVTDPPYGKSTVTLKRTTVQIVEEMMAAVHGLLDKGKRVCLAAPKKLNIGSVGVALGYRHLESHFVYVHRSLTREVAVFEKE